MSSLQKAFHTCRTDLYQRDGPLTQAIKATEARQNQGLLANALR